MMTITLTVYIFLLSCLYAASVVEALQLQQGGVQLAGAVSAQCRRSRNGRELFLSSPGAGPEENYDDVVPPVPPPPEGWSYPKFDSIASTIDKHVSMDRSSMDPGKDSMVYTLKEGFMPQDRSWIRLVRDDRMTENSKVLYRPKMVYDLVQTIDEFLATNRTRGVLVKGPQGVGKSYSLINLARYLLANGNYWVTIIPNCEKWKSGASFFNFLLQSVGVNPVLFKLKYNLKNEEDFKKLISDIDHVLSKHGKKWVFVFDQINRVFARPDCQGAKDVGVLPFPFSMIKEVITPGRIISIISASANNDVSYKDNHGDFEDYDHPNQFDQTEVELLYPASEIARWNQDDVDFATGRVPLYLSRWAKENSSYEGEVYEEIKLSLEKLRRERRDVWKDFVDSAIQCVLHLPSTARPTHFDRKFSIRKKETVRGEESYNVIALFPLVEQSYRLFFWKNLFRQIKERETKILNVCVDSRTTNDVRGRLFEELVIARLVTDDLSRDDLKTVLAASDTTIDEDWETDFRQPVLVSQLTGQKYPEGAYVLNQITYFIPGAPNFPAVDLIIRLRKVVIAMQIHTGDHNDVSTKLIERADNAKWTAPEVEKIILVYLSPTRKTRDDMQRKCDRNAPLPVQGDRVTTLFFSIEQFRSLGTLPWLG